MLKMIAVIVGTLGALASGFFVFQSASAFKSLGKSATEVSGHSGDHGEESHASASTGHGESASAGHGEASAEHGESASAGHGESASAGHGESASAGHGESAPSGHGEASAGHGSASSERAPAHAKGMVPFITLDEIFANISDDKSSHTLAVKLDVELFDDQAKQAFKGGQPAVKHMIIQTSREQNYEQLATLSGKLYFKELLIRKMNEHFQKPVVRDVHFSSFFLQ
jgi:flagellar basal body-associated protein FliL